MPFAYYTRLSRAQQAIYRRSDAVAEVPLARPWELHPAVEALVTALGTEQRVDTQRATERLIAGLTQALGMPPVRVEVLAARPHARWGELHGLYTAEPHRTPKIQLWMRTAKQKRVVAFRTYLRTLLHEVGHHIDYTLLRLPDSFHTEGFYKRESSLFAQLVPEVRRRVVTVDEYARRTADERLTRLARTPDEIAALLAGKTDRLLAHRPAPAAWAATEVVGHFRDAEELFMTRFETMLAMTEPRLVEVGPSDRWAEERQYLRHDTSAALAAFRARRAESLARLRALPAADWQRGGIHPVRNRLSIDDLVAIMAWHDDNHLDQLARALEGKP
jgi:DinB family protein